MFASTRLICVTSTLLLLISISLTKASLTQIELREKFGQVGTSFNDGKSCHRTCDGKTKTCFFEFRAQYFDTLSSLCKACANGTLADCFNTGCITGSGIERAIMTMNQQLPGPAINVCKGDLIIVDVTNHMPGQGLTIHWHGIHQHKTPWMDGIGMVTQCPINAANTFRYAFYASEEGSQFWHAHTGLHRSNGLVGSLVVREYDDINAELYDYDLAEHTVLLMDFDNHIAEDKMPGVRSIITLPNSLLINGRGSYYDSTADENKFAPMAVFYMQRGKRHRLRFINIGSHVCQFGITVEGHSLTLIATDGYPVEPLVVDSFASSPGERYDVVMHATSDPTIAETLLTVRTVESCGSTLQEFARIIFVDDVFNHPKTIVHHAPLTKRPPFDSFKLTPPKVTLNYPQANCKSPYHHCIASVKQKITPTSIGVNLRNVEPYEVIPLHFKMVKIQRRPFVYLDVDDDAKVATINRIENAPSTVPGLVQDDSSVGYCSNLPGRFDSKLPQKSDIALDNRTIYHCPHLIHMKLDKVYEILLIDDTTDEPIAHPVHVHGYSFNIIDMGTHDELYSGKTPYADATYPPVRKDTVTLPQNGFARLRLRSVNPGYWLLHCHIEHHSISSAGMVIILKVGDKDDIQPPPLGFPTCGDYLIPINEY